MSGLPRAVRAVLLIGAAVIALSVTLLHVTWPVAGVSTKTVAPRATVAPVQSRQVVSQRLVGTAVIRGVTFTSPHLGQAEYGVVDALIVQGLDVERVDEAPWGGGLQHAVADVVTTDAGSLTLVAPTEPGHPLWACPAQIEGAIIGGGDALSYEFGVGGDRLAVQISGPIIIGRIGDALVLTYDQQLWRRLQVLVQPVVCPQG